MREVGSSSIWIRAGGPPRPLGWWHSSSLGPAPALVSAAAPPAGSPAVVTAGTSVSCLFFFFTFLLMFFFCCRYYRFFCFLCFGGQYYPFLFVLVSLPAVSVFFCWFYINETPAYVSLALLLIVLLFLLSPVASVVNLFSCDFCFPSAVYCC